MSLELYPDQLLGLEGLGCRGTFQSQLLLTFELFKYVGDQASAA
jgi:hypothetical protein